MKRTIVCFGDSNTHGYDSRSGGRFDEETRWPMRLERLLGEGFRICEEGLSGRTTVFEDPMTEGLSGLPALYPVLMTHEPVDLLIVMLGTNDVKARFGTTAENVAKGMERLLRKALSVPEAFRNGKPELLLIAPFPIGKGYEKSAVRGEMGEGCAERSERLRPLYRALSERLSLHYLDAAELPGMENYPYDEMHLSPEGHRVLSEAVAEKIKEIFSQEEGE